MLRPAAGVGAPAWGSPPSANDPTRGANTAILVLFVFSSFSRLPEFLGSHGVTFVALGLSLASLILVALSGELMAALRSFPGITLMALTGWMFLGMPFSVSPLGAFDVVTDIWIKSLAVYFLIVGGVVVFPHYRKLMITVAFAAVAINLFSFRYGYLHGGRLAVGGGTFSNSNDLATYLLTGMPFSMYALMRAQNARKLFWLGTLAAALYFVLKTGSRGALVALLGAVLYVFWKINIRKKALMMMAGIGGLLLAPIVIPPRVYVRYTSMFSSDSQSTRDAQIAEGSKRARMALLEKSIRVTRDNPVFGVGPGMFKVAARVTHVSHNMYTQLSSETGVPGFLMYMTALAYCFRRTAQVMKKTRPDPTLTDIYEAAFAIRVALIIYMITSVFGSVAYGVPVMLLIGMAEALQKTAEPEIQARRRAALAAAPLPPVAPRRFVNA